jgi:hypothetical protein
MSRVEMGLSASGIPAAIVSLSEKIDELTEVSKEAVERSMRNNTLDVLREENAKLQGEVSQVKHLLQEAVDDNVELRGAVDSLNETNSELQQAVDAKD